jgi:hypothetical protein
VIITIMIMTTTYLSLWYSLNSRPGVEDVAGAAVAPTGAGAEAEDVDAAAAVVPPSRTLPVCLSS